MAKKKKPSSKPSGEGAEKTPASPGGDAEGVVSQPMKIGDTTTRKPPPKPAPAPAPANEPSTAPAGSGTGGSAGAAKKKKKKKKKAAARPAESNATEPTAKADAATTETDAKEPEPAPVKAAEPAPPAAEAETPVAESKDETSGNAEDSSAADQADEHEQAKDDDKDDKQDVRDSKPAAGTMDQASDSPDDDDGDSGSEKEPRDDKADLPRDYDAAAAADAVSAMEDDDNERAARASVAHDVATARSALADGDDDSPTHDDDDYSAVIAGETTWLRPLSLALNVVLMILLLGICVAFIDRCNLRVDATEDQRFSLSPATRDVLDDLRQHKEKVTIRYYYSADELRPQRFQFLPRDVESVLRDLRDYAPDHIQYEMIEVPTAGSEGDSDLNSIFGGSSAASDDDDEKLTEDEQSARDLRRWLKDQEIEPIAEQVREQDRMSVLSYYSAFYISFAARVPIRVFKAIISKEAQEAGRRIEDYSSEVLTRALARLLEAEPPKVGLLVGHGEVYESMGSQANWLFERMRRDGDYEPVRVDLEGGAKPVPLETDIIATCERLPTRWAEVAEAFADTLNYDEGDFKLKWTGERPIQRETREKLKSFDDQVTAGDGEVMVEMTEWAQAVDTLVRRSRENPTLIVCATAEAPTDRTLYEIDQFIMRGGRVILFADPAWMDFGQTIRNPDRKWAEHFAKYGLNLLQQAISDKRSVQFTASDENFWAAIEPEGDGILDHPATAGTAKVLLINPGPIKPDDTIVEPLSGYDAQRRDPNRPAYYPIMRSSTDAWTRRASEVSPSGYYRGPKWTDTTLYARYDVAASVEGRFKSAFANENEPDRPAPAMPIADADKPEYDRLAECARETAIICITDVDILNNQFEEWNENGPFVMGAVDYAVHGTRFLDLQRRGARRRPLDVESQNRGTIRALVILTVPLGLIMIGIGIVVFRWQERYLYQARLQAQLALEAARARIAVADRSASASNDDEEDADE